MTLQTSEWPELSYSVGIIPCEPQVCVYHSVRILPEISMVLRHKGSGLCFGVSRQPVRGEEHEVVVLSTHMHGAFY